MTLGMQVGIDPGHIVLDGDPAPPPPKGHRPPIFGPYQLRPNGCIDQDATWYGGRPRPRRLCVRWGPAPFRQKGVGSQIFGPCLLWPNSRMDQDGTWHRARPSLGDLVVLNGDPAPLSKKGAEPLPNFQPISIVAKRLDAPRCHLVWR